MKFSSLKLEVNGMGFGKVWMDGQEVKGCKSVEIFVAAGEPPVAKIEFFVEKLEVEVERVEDTSKYPRL